MNISEINTNSKIETKLNNRNMWKEKEIKALLKSYKCRMSECNKSGMSLDYQLICDDLTAANIFKPVTPIMVKRKIQHLLKIYETKKFPSNLKSLNSIIEFNDLLEEVFSDTLISNADTFAVHTQQYQTETVAPATPIRCLTSTEVTSTQNPPPATSIRYLTSTQNPSEINKINPVNKSTENKHDECYVAGRRIGLQLKNLDSQQCMFAEKLISDIIFYGRMKRLSENTSVTVDSYCSDLPIVLTYSTETTSNDENKSNIRYEHKHVTPSSHQKIPFIQLDSSSESEDGITS